MGASFKLPKRKAAVIAFRVLLVLVLLEAGLRISGYAFVVNQNSGNSISDTESAYRILVLGDSTSANLRNGQGSWPEELEIILNNRSKSTKYAVFNEAHPSMTTQKMIDELEGNLEKYRPHMIMAMIGGNDAGIYIQESEKEITDRLLAAAAELRIYKMSRTFLKSMLSKGEKSGTIAGEPFVLNIPTGSETPRDYLEKEQRLLKLLEENESNTTAMFDLMELYQANGRNENLTALVKKLVSVQPPKSSEAYRLLGIMLEQAGSPEEAAEMFLAGITLNPKNEALHLHLANTYNRLGRNDEASYYYEEYLNMTRAMDTHVFIQLSRIYTEQGNAERAYPMLKALMLTNSKLDHEIFWMGGIYEQLNKTDEVVPILMAMTLEDKNNTAAWTELAWHYLRKGEPDKAEIMLEQVRKANPRFLKRAYEVIAERYERNGEAEKARAMLEQAAQADDSYYNPDTRHNLKKLHAIAKERGMPLAIVQYPLLEIEEIQDKVFQGQEDIIFVSNEENFRKALRHSAPEKLFVDPEAEPPHLTRRGNIMVAENAAVKVLAAS